MVRTRGTNRGIEHLIRWNCGLPPWPECTRPARLRRRWSRLASSIGDFSGYRDGKAHSRRKWLVHQRQPRAGQLASRAISWPFRCGLLALTALLAASVWLSEPASSTSDALAQEPTGRWLSLAPMNTPRSEVGVGALDGKVYVLAGFLPGRVPTGTAE